MMIYMIKEIYYFSGSGSSFMPITCEHTSCNGDSGQTLSEEAFRRRLIFKSLLKNDISDRQEFLAFAEKLGFRHDERKCMIWYSGAGVHRNSSTGCNLSFSQNWKKR